jgi:hypothetical protein
MEPSAGFAVKKDIMPLAFLVSLFCPYDIFPFILSPPYLPCPGSYKLHIYDTDG